MYKTQKKRRPGRGFSHQSPTFKANGNGQKKSNKSKRPKQLDPSLLIKKSAGVEVKEYVSNRTIQQLPISDLLKKSLSHKGFERPTEIQDKTLEALIERTDLLGIAQTGTGKTGAFLIPIIEHLIHKNTPSFALIIVPTRELALQVQEEFFTMTKGLGLRSSCFIGGTNMGKDYQNLKRNNHVVIGTPGRLLDLYKRKALDLRKFQTLVLDEFDRMLDMGFVQDVRSLIDGMQDRNHSMLFSATINNSQQKIINEILHDPITVKVTNGTTTADSVDQDVIRIKHGELKFDVLMSLLADEEYKRVLIFEETKHRVDKLCTMLNKAGIKAEQIHGDKSQNARQKALASFKQGRANVLVATDVAARGIDVSDVTHVINYQIPTSYDNYIHRIGRTGRAGKVGKAITLVDYSK